MSSELDRLDQELAALERGQNTSRAPRNLKVWIIILGLFFVGLGGLWMAYTSTRKAPPLLKPPGPIRHRPSQQPRALGVPDQDKSIYTRLEGGKPDAKKKIERLLPEPKKEPPRTTASQATDKKVPVTPPPVVAPPPKKKTIPLPSAPVTPLSKKTQAKKALHEKTLRWHVQVGSVPSEKDAHQVWATSQKKAPTLLGTLSSHIQKVQIKGKTFHRVQAGSFTSHAEAVTFCQRLRKKKIQCLPARS